MGNNGAKTKEMSVCDANSGVKATNESSFCPVTKLRDFLVDYCNRHSHPVNAALHLVGVPAAFTGFFFLFTGKDVQKGSLLVFLGYLFQYLGHRAQGNEVGEVTLAKSLYRKISGRNR